MTTNHKVLVAYVASPHAGYLQLFRQYAGGTLYILGEAFVQEEKVLVRHLPGNTPEDAATMIRALNIFSRVEILTLHNLAELPESVTMPDEDISRRFAVTHLTQRTVFFDSGWMLRWTWENATHNKAPSNREVITRENFAQAYMSGALKEAAHSPDWWRQIGALLVKDGAVLIRGHNTHMPTNQEAYVMGDPRSNFEAGEHIDVSVAIHAEATVIAEAARRGIATAGCDLYVTTFPCPPCANLIAHSGIRRVFYAGGYSLVRGAESLLSKGVAIIRVEF